MGVAFSSPLLTMVAILLLACFLSAAQATGYEQVHVSGSTGPTVVKSGHAPVYAPYYYGYGPFYASHYYPYYPVRHAYSYVPAASTHGYGNVNHATGTPFVYSREHPDPHYGEQEARQGYSSYSSTVYPYVYTPVSYPYRHPYSYVPAASTHGYGNVNHATGTGYVYSRQHPD